MPLPVSNLFRTRIRDGVGVSDDHPVAGVQAGGHGVGTAPTRSIDSGGKWRLRPFPDRR